MKVYVMTKANLFQPELYIGVKISKKDAIKALRAEYPHMTPEASISDTILCFAADKLKEPLLFIHEEDI